MKNKKKYKIKTNSQNTKKNTKKFNKFQKISTNLFKQMKNKDIIKKKIKKNPKR